ncbi:MAG: class I SAM-dependent methyltransferase [Pseudomonadales bacterium]|nr:class I SAM-dependent methyltransferase [Pseudomonadales bacterium]
MNDKSRIIRWDERYQGDEYLFGTEPNDFLVEMAERVPGGSEVLCLADGEGRNGVYLAGLGHKVTSVDSSAMALAKAKKLALEKNVVLETVMADLTEHDLGEDRWDCIVSIFFHMPSEIRRQVHGKVERAIRPGGMLILEAYTPKQLEFRTGGPPMEDYLMTLAALREDFANLEFLHAEEKEREVYEGKGHAGHAAVVQLVAKK